MPSSASEIPKSSQTDGLQHELDRLVSGYSRLQRLLEIAGVTVFFSLTVIVLSHIGVLSLALPIAWPGILGLGLAAGLAALLFADFASGVVHWAADNWGSDTWPILGAAFIRPFRLHHLDEKDITRHTFAELNGNNCLVSLPTFYVAERALVDGSSSGLFWGMFWFAVAWWVLGTNQFHAWAHADERPAGISVLQKMRLILPPAHHHQHHISPHDRNYCITTGWLNYPLRVTRFFEGIEWLVFKLTGVRPHHDTLPVADRAANSSPGS